LNREDRLGGIGDGMNQANRKTSWEEHNSFFEALGREIPWIGRFRLWSYYLLLDRKTSKPIRRMFKILGDMAYVVYFLGKCMFFSIFARRARFPAGRTLVLLSTAANYHANLAPVIDELEKRKHSCVFIYSRRRKKQVTELYGVSEGAGMDLISFERALSTVGRLKSLREYAFGMVRAWKDLHLFLKSGLPSNRLIGPHFFVWSFLQHLFSGGCTDLLAVSRNMVAMNDYFLWESIYYQCAQDLNIGTYILQHGVLSAAYSPPLTKKYLLWGEIEEAQFTGSLGCSDKGYFLTGSPKYDGIREKYLQRKRPFEERKKIIFVSSMLRFFTQEYRPEYLEICKWFSRLSILDGTEGYAFIFKIHPFENIHAYKGLFKQDSSRVTVEGGNLFDHLLDARIAISHGSTAIYESLVMEVPAIQAVPEKLPTSVQFWKWGLTEHASTFEEFQREALRLITDDLHFQSAVNRINALNNKAFFNLGHSSQIIADILEENYVRNGIGLQ